MSRPYTFDRVSRMVITAVCIVGFVWLVNDLRNVLLPFCVACLISYFLEPVVEFCLTKLHLRWRILAIFVTLGGVAAIVGTLAYFFLPSVLDELKQMGDLLKDYSDRNEALPFIPQSLHENIAAYIDNDIVKKFLDGQQFESLIDKGFTLVSTSVEYVMHIIEWFLTFIYVIFILLDYRQLMRGFRMLVPPKYRPIVEKVGGDITDNMNRYFRGQAVLALCAAVFYCIGFSIVGLPMSIVLGILTGVLYMIPYFQYVTLIPVAFVCLLSSMSGDAGFWALFGRSLIVYVVSQSICDYILTPKIMGKALGLNPAIILLSLSVWGTLLGLIGMIIALPLTTLLLAYYEEYIIRRGSGAVATIRSIATVQGPPNPLDSLKKGKN